jgi:hypothetical protein
MTDVIKIGIRSKYLALAASETPSGLLLYLGFYGFQWNFKKED